MEIGVDVFAVCCTANILSEVINDFLRSAYGNSLEHCLLLITSLATLQAKPTKPTEPPINEFTSPFLGMTVEEVAEQMHAEGVRTTFFAVLDERSAEDSTALLVHHEDSKVDTIRVGFEAVNNQLIKLEMITFDLVELKSIAAKMEGGVYRDVIPEERERGGPAPRKQLKAPRKQLKAPRKQLKAPGKQLKTEPSTGIESE